MSKQNVSPLDGGDLVVKSLLKWRRIIKDL